MTGPLLKEGDRVEVLSLKQIGAISEFLPDGRIRVAVGSFSIVCSSDEVIRSSAKQPAAPPPALQGRLRSAAAPRSIDLHGMSAAQAAEAVQQYVSQLVLNGSGQGKIIHGLGTGRLQQEVHRVLGSLSVVRAYRLNDRNPGETDVYLH